jgi:hypothetical protein
MHSLFADDNAIIYFCLAEKTTADMLHAKCRRISKCYDVRSERQ